MCLAHPLSPCHVLMCLTHTPHPSNYIMYVLMYLTTHPTPPAPYKCPYVFNPPTPLPLLYINVLMCSTYTPHPSYYIMYVLMYLTQLGLLSCYVLLFI